MLSLYVRFSAIFLQRNSHRSLTHMLSFKLLQHCKGHKSTYPAFTGGEKTLAAHSCFISGSSKSQIYTWAESIKDTVIKSYIVHHSLQHTSEVNEKTIWKI